MVSERIGRVRHELAAKRIQTKGNTALDHRDLIINDSKKIIDTIHQLLDSLQPKKNELRLPQEQIDEYLEYLEAALQRYIKADLKYSDKYASVKHYKKLTDKEKTDLLLGLVQDFNTINGTLETPKAGPLAVYHSPTIIEDIVENPSIPEELKLPSALRQVAINNPAQPIAAVEKMRDNFLELQNDARISAEFKAANPGLLREIAIHYPKKAGDVLLKVEQNYIALRESDTGKEYQDQPGFLLHVAYKHLNDPFKGIQEIERKIEKLKKNKSVPDEYKRPWMLRRLVTRHSSPREAITEIEIKVSELEVDNKIPEYCKAARWFLRFVVLQYPDKSKEALLEAIKQAALLSKDNDIPKEIRDNQLLMTYICVGRPNTAKDTLRNPEKMREYRKIFNTP